jgi:hypothetical protein
MLWRRVDHPGLEWCRVLSDRERTTIFGVVLLSFARKACRLEYVIECDSAWKTRAAAIKGTVGQREIDIALKVDSRKRWYRNGTHIDAVDGCVDVDLGFSPSTNLLPIRRCGLRRGAPVAVTAAWVEFPSFTLKTLSQVYLRKDDRVIHYESAGGKFHRDLVTNNKGLVVRYPGLWESVLLE